VDDRRTWLVIGTIALVFALLFAGFLWYLNSVSTSGSEPGEGMIPSGLLLLRAGTSR
jgi:hypothetical protein